MEQDAQPGQQRRFSRRRWLILFGIIAMLVFIACLNFERLERIVIAYHVYHSHIFTPPPRMARESAWSRPWHDAEFYWDFSELFVARAKRLREFNPELKPLVKEIQRRQAAGEGMQYSMHIYREIRWYLNFTNDEQATHERIKQLRNSLSQPEMQELAAEQQPSDGSWGLGLTAWYLRLYYSVEDGLSSQASLKYRMSIFDRINSPEKLTAELNSVLYDDFTKTGVFNREELDETFSAIARILFGHKQTDYAFDPGLKDALKQFVDNWQNPVTACWGQWLIDSQGRVWKMDDMAMTFHVVSDLKGNINHLDRIAQRLLEIGGLNFPAGLRFNGHYEDHLNMDAVKIFRLAWPHLDEPTRAQVRAEISRMLDWCLTQSYQPDGSFRMSELDDTLGDAYAYGVQFLTEAGYFNRANRFWTDQDFPQAEAARNQIEAKIKSIGLSDPDLRDAYQTLQDTK